MNRIFVTCDTLKFNRAETLLTSIIVTFRKYKTIYFHFIITETEFLLCPCWMNILYEVWGYPSNYLQCYYDLLVLLVVDMFSPREPSCDWISPPCLSHSLNILQCTYSDILVNDRLFALNCAVFISDWKYPLLKNFWSQKLYLI